MTDFEAAGTGSVLVTGGTGYVGSHIVAELMLAGAEVSILDDLSNSNGSVVERLEQLTGRRPVLFVGDVRDPADVDAAFAESRPSSVIHCAGLKSVAESMQIPERYMAVNVGGSANVIDSFARSDSRRLVFSSSCTVYGGRNAPPVRESSVEDPVSPYGVSKLIVEQMLRELSHRGRGKSVVSLRYFNPIGAHPSGLIGENPVQERRSVMLQMMDAASGLSQAFEIFGTDYATPDGTAVRDYVHVVDVARSHSQAISDHLSGLQPLEVANVGLGFGVSVRELLREFESSTGVSVPIVESDRRPGDVPAVWCDPSHAEQALGWNPTFSLADACADAWRFHRARGSSLDQSRRRE